jgi:CHASE3 domain sensor protein
LIAGEIIIFFVFLVVGKFMPQSTAAPVRFGPLFYFLCLGLFVMAGVSFFAYADTYTRLSHMSKLADQFLTMLKTVDALKDMESSQRGYLLTGRNYYLEPYKRKKDTIDQRCEEIKKFYRGTPDEERAFNFTTLVMRKVDELDKTVNLKLEGKKAESEEALFSDEGKNTMDLLMMTGRDMAEKGLGEYKRTQEGLRSVAAVRIYMAVTIAFGAILQIIIAAMSGQIRKHQALSG